MTTQYKLIAFSAITHRIAPLQDALDQNLSLQQYFLTQLIHASPTKDQKAFWLGVDAEITGELKGHLIQLSLNQLLKQHSLLNAHFSDSGMHIASYDRIRAIELRPELNFDEQVSRLSDFSHCQDRPLVQAFYQSQGNQKWRLQLWIHHLIADGTAAGIAIHSLNKLYHSLSSLDPVWGIVERIKPALKDELQDLCCRLGGTIFPPILSPLLPSPIPGSVLMPIQNQVRENQKRVISSPKFLSELTQLGQEITDSACVFHLDDEQPITDQSPLSCRNATLTLPQHSQEALLKYARVSDFAELKPHKAISLILEALFYQSMTQINRGQFPLARQPKSARHFQSIIGTLQHPNHAFGVDYVAISELFPGPVRSDMSASAIMRAIMNTQRNTKTRTYHKQVPAEALLLGLGMKGAAIEFNYKDIDIVPQLNGCETTRAQRLPENLWWWGPHYQVRLTCDVDASDLTCIKVAFVSSHMPEGYADRVLTQFNENFQALLSQ